MNNDTQIDIPAPNVALRPVVRQWLRAGGWLYLYRAEQRAVLVRADGKAERELNRASVDAAIARGLLVPANTQSSLRNADCYRLPKPKVRHGGPAHD